MKIYAAGEAASQAASFNVHIAPAADRDGLEHIDPPNEWFDTVVEDGKKVQTPRQIVVTFRHGEADVQGSIGKYLIARKMARASKFIMPGDAS